MRRAQQSNAIALNQQATDPYPLPAPVKGWNKRDPLSQMKEGYAVTLDNWFPLPYSIQTRFGSADWATDITDEGGTPVETTVNTLITYRPKSGNQELWGFAGALLFDVSSTGAVGSSEVSGLSNDEWNCINAATTGDNFLLCVNGVDLMLAYDGTDWEDIDGTSTMFAITNVATSDLINLFSYGSRVFYFEKASMSLWYTAAGAVGGALTELDLSALFTKGGYLLGGGTWSVDAGDGQDDLAAFVSSEGEVLVYAGTNPADAAAWRKIGLYQIGKPIGRRCTKKYGGDLLLLTVEGVISAAAAFQVGREQSAPLALSDTIQGAVAESGPLYADTYGWHMETFPGASMLLVNVPELDGVKQWVMNTVTKAWGRFKGWETKCFEVFNDELYFGTLGAVVKAWTGTSDRGASIACEVLTAFSYFGQKARTKQFNMMRPNIEWDANPLSLKVGFDVDYKIQTPTQEIALAAASGGSLWDTGEWDEAVWGGSLVVQSEWYGIDGEGLAGAPHMIFESSVSSARLTSFDIMKMPGSVFG